MSGLVQTDMIRHESFLRYQGSQAQIMFGTICTFYFVPG